MIEDDPEDRSKSEKRAAAIAKAIAERLPPGSLEAPAEPKADFYAWWHRQHQRDSWTRQEAALAAWKAKASDDAVVLREAREALKDAIECVEESVPFVTGSLLHVTVQKWKRIAFSR